MTRTKPTLLALVLGLIPFGPLATASPQEKPIDPEIAAQQKRGQIQKLLDDIVIDTNGLQEQMPLAKFLVALEAKLPEGKKLSVRIDEAAFGKRLSQVTAAQVRLPFMKKVRLATVLRRVLAEVTKVEQVDYGIRPTGVVITRPQLAAHSMVYDVRDIVEQMPFLLPDLKRQSAAVYHGLKSNQGAALLVRLVINEVSLQPWETIQVLNGSRLVVLASPTRHGEVVDLLAALRGLSDVAVVMNARLYEVDRSFFTKHVAPLFAGDKDLAERPLVLPIEGPLFKTISQQKFLLASEDIKIKPNQVTPFLSRHSVFRFATGSRKDQEERVQLNSEDRMVTGTGLAGVSFAVRPLVSPDRRYLRLQISQKVSQLVGIKKTKTLDLSSGKELEVESPNLRETSVTGTVQILDGNPILMPSSYRPPGKESEGKVWLLVARPFIWIEQEVKQIRKGGGDVSAKSIWDSETQQESKPALATPLPFNDEVKEILQAVITDVLTNPSLKDTREFYGTAKDKTFTLVDNGKLGWPKGFNPETHGFKLVNVKEDPFVNPRRVLGIRLDKFDLKQKERAMFDSAIEICLFNAGGSANGDVIGGCSVYYNPKQVSGKWAVEFEALRDP